MQKNIAQMLLIAFLILGCSAPPPSLPVASPTSTSSTLTSAPLPTSTQSPATLTPLPTYTAQPPTSTSTPESGLQTNGPYFAYFQESNLTLRLVLMDVDGKGRKTIDLPKEISDSFASGNLPAPDIRLLSPDGQWLAFYTSGPLTLNLFNLETGETQVVTPLLSKDYPNNFTEAAAKLNNPDITADSLHDAFNAGITQAIAWSPDGKYLAFAGQMDGLSSDLYVYETQTKKIQQLSSGDQELQWINWSPDGKRIVHSAVFAVGEGMTYDIYVASLDSSLVPHISTNVLGTGIEDWLNAHQYFENDGQNGPGPYGLRLVDINTGGIIKVWDGSFGSYAVDKSGNWVLLLAYSPDTTPFNTNGFDFDPNFVPALYLVNLKTLHKSKVEVPDGSSISPNIQSFGVAGQDFVLRDQTTNSPVFFSVSGTWTPTDVGDVQISVSPNFKYWLTFGQQIKIFSADNTLLATSDNPGGYINVSWRADSLGAFLVSNSEIYSLTVPDGNMQLVGTDLLQSQNYVSTYGWINGQ